MKSPGEKWLDLPLIEPPLVGYDRPARFRAMRILRRACVTVALYLLMTAIYTLLLWWRLTDSWRFALALGLIAAAVSLAGAFLKRGLPTPGAIDRSGHRSIRFGGGRH